MKHFLDRKKQYSVAIIIVIFGMIILYFLCDELKSITSDIIVFLLLSLLSWCGFVRALIPPQKVGMHSTLKYYYFKKGNLEKYQIICFRLFLFFLCIAFIFLIRFFISSLKI